MKKEAFHVGNSKKSALKRSFVHYFWLGTRPNSKLENSNFSSFKNFEFFEFRVFRVWRKTEFFEFRVTRVLEISSFSSFESNSKLEISSYFEFFRNSSLALTTLIDTHWATFLKFQVFHELQIIEAFFSGNCKLVHVEECTSIYDEKNLIVI